MDTILIIGICILIVTVSSFLGKTIQKITDFIIPLEFITISITVAPLIASIFINDLLLWVLPWIFGYFLGYCLTSNKKWLTIGPVNLKEITPGVFPKWIVPYIYEGKWCIQKQCNKALFFKIFFKIHHYVDTNVPLAPNGRLHYAGHPWMPRVGDEIMYLDKYMELPPKIIKIGRFKVKKHSTYIRVPNTLLASPLERMLREESYARASKAVTEISADNIFLKNEVQNEIMNTALNLVKNSTVEKKPLSVYMKDIKDLREKHPDIFYEDLNKKSDSDEGEDNNEQ
ncbi:MAG: hypothetical protein FWD92_03610 [Methanomassiliicoccaceae archaeon]|nr:hypothetical protein [Methanomassiliicoccaceae archaeon]